MRKQILVICLFHFSSNWKSCHWPVVSNLLKKKKTRLSGLDAFTNCWIFHITLTQLTIKEHLSVIFPNFCTVMFLCMVLTLLGWCSCSPLHWISHTEVSLNICRLGRKPELKKQNKNTKPVFAHSGNCRLTCVEPKGAVSSRWIVSSPEIIHIAS